MKKTTIKTKRNHNKTAMKQIKKRSIDETMKEANEQEKHSMEYTYTTQE